MTPFSRHDDPLRAKPLIEQSISRFGWATEHNAEHFYHAAEPDLRNVFFMTQEGSGILAQLSDEWWYIFSEPLAPEGSRGKILADFCDLAFSDPKTEKVIMEVASKTRRELLKALSPGLRSCAIAETFLWPVLDLMRYDASFSGSAYKSLRNAKSRFFREHRVETRNAREMDPAGLHDIVERWKSGRKATHEGILGSYHAMISDNFSGTDSAQALMVDGKPEALNAGWLIPRSDTYYMAVSLHSYAHWGLGEIATMEDLRRAKERGYAHADLGGSDKKLLAFKKQFGEVETYKTHQFSIVRADKQ